MSARTKSLILAPVGLLLFCYGLVVLIEAMDDRRIGQPLQLWLLLGIYSLVLINGGLVLFAESIRYRIITDVRKEARRNMRRFEQKYNSKSNRKSKPVKKAKSPTKTD